MNTYQVELADGTTVKRNSKLSFTHAVVAHLFDNDTDKGLHVWAFAGSKELAEKSLRTFANRTAKNSYAKTTYEIIEVKVGA